MKLLPLPALTDNYLWLLHHAGRALVVDPGDAAPVLQALERSGLELEAILVTHHHGDHVGGVDALAEHTGARVYGPARELPGHPWQRCHHGDRLALLGRPWQVIEVPGHTAGHVAYHAPAHAGEPGLLFCGDTLFSAGCGRLFEGTAAQMHASLQRLAALPPDTLVCCAHEYTLSNLRFARAVEPGNATVAEHLQHCEALRAAGLPTLPSTLALEQRVNPFLRVHAPDVVASLLQRAPGLRADDPVALWAALREWKNEFR